MNFSAKDPAQLRAALPLFHEFSVEEMGAFLELADSVTFPAGATIVRQDDSGDCMYILIEGKARVVHRRDGREFEVVTLAPGDFFGELALVDAGPRSADVVAVDECVLLKAPQMVLRSLAGIHPHAAIKLFMAIAHVVVGRVRRTNLRYLDSLTAAANLGE